MASRTDTVAFRKQARAWCRNKYGVRWHEEGMNKERMTEAYATLIMCMEGIRYQKQFKPEGMPDVMLVRDLDACFYINFEEDTPEWAEEYDGRIGGYHAIALPTTKDLRDDDLSVVLTDKKGANHFRKYTEEDRSKDWAILSEAKCAADLRGMTYVEWGKNSPEELHEGVITVYGPFPALTEHVAFMQHSYDSYLGYTAHWLDEVPEGSGVGDDIVLGDGRRARVMGEWLLEHVRPRMNAALQERSEYPASVLPKPEE